MEKEVLTTHTHSVSLSLSLTHTHLKNLTAQRLGTLLGKNLLPMSPDYAQLCPWKTQNLG